MLVKFVGSDVLHLGSVPQLHCTKAGLCPPEPGFIWPRNKNVGAENLHGPTALRVYDSCGVRDSEVHSFIEEFM